MMKQFQTRISPFSIILSILVFIGIVWLALNAVRFLWWLALFLTPVFLIVTLFLKKELLFNHFKKIITGIQNDFLLGIIKAIFSLIILPFSSFLLMVQALMLNKMDGFFENNSKQQKSEYIDYEEIDSEQHSFDLLDANKKSKHN